MEDRINEELAHVIKVIESENECPFSIKVSLQKFYGSLLLVKEFSLISDVDKLILCYQ